MYQVQRRALLQRATMTRSYTTTNVFNMMAPVQRTYGISTNINYQKYYQHQK